ncbi:MAG TPA: hypothetical protein VEK37_12720 [Gemmatimonadaceae bacterium]|nr:hypothetical protein [Gemmatimonadaceae bacterium]
MKSVPRGYGTHADFLDMVRESATRRAEAVQAELRTAFRQFVREEPVLVIQLADINVHDLAQILRQHPLVLKPLVIAANVAARAIERDLGIANVDTYEPKLSPEESAAIAGYLKPFLPASVALPTLVQLDQVEYVDKEIRAQKGRWEKRVTDALSRESGRQFAKRKIDVQGEGFEIDAAFPPNGDVKFAVDIKRIEARRDFHKRVDEIVNKATKVKKHNPGAKFGTVIYFPFEDQHAQIRNRLGESAVDAVAFANELDQSIERASADILKSFAMSR